MKKLKLKLADGCGISINENEISEATEEELNNCVN